MQPSEARILVADDESALREIFAKWLGTIGCGRVETAEDGAAALAMLEAGDFDLLISDVRMPRMDGITLVRRLAELGRTVPSIIFVSGFGDVDEREMYGQGVEAFLSKPLRMEELVGAIRRALAERSALWRVATEPPPRQAMELELSAGAAVRFGRGGFSVGYDPPLSLGKVSFRCSEGGRVWLSGQGLVRWRSKPEGRVGVEFTYLEEESRARVLEAMEAEHPRCFIPA
jgi:CheY-like chemotaxis protein